MGDWRGVVTTTKKTTAKPRERKAKAVTTSEAIKGFNHDMTCLGFQFEIGKEYSVPGKVVPCKNGFHACPVDTVDPMRVFGFYPPGKSRYCIVEQGGEIVPHGDDKAASGTIFVRKGISIGEIIDRAVAYRLKSARATGETSNSGYSGVASNSGTRGAASNSGDYGAASNSGYSGVASNSGARGVASNSGTRGAASNSGNYGAASNSGNYGAASNSGDSGVASNSGNYGAASNSGNYGAASNSGYSGVASNSGARGVASNSGTRGAASNSGDYGAASNSGYGGAASNSGYGGAASNSGVRGAAFSHAYNSKVLCEGDGQALYITEFADDGSIASVACGVTGRDGIKAGIWYVCKGGKLVPAEKSA
jgi:hypothetical protein